MKNPTLDDILIPGTDPLVRTAYRSYAALAKEAVFGLEEEEIVIMDTETTGFSAVNDELIEIAAAIMKGPRILDTFQTFVNPGRTIPPEIVELTSITDDMVAGAPTPDRAVQRFVEFCGERQIVAHNAAFDKGFITQRLFGDVFDNEWIDSLELSRIAFPRLREHSLAALSSAFGIEGASHRAQGDVEALCGLWRVILVGLDALPPGFLNLLVDLKPSVPWPARSIISHLAAADPDTRFSLTVQRRQMASMAKIPTKVDAAECVGDFPTVRSVEECFAPGGVVTSMYPSFEQRDEQVAMADEVIEAFQTSTHRLIEAGTGVGKSIAYLIPAALTARKLSIGVGVATKTNALMDQLVFHELPALKEALGGKLEYVSLKGYEHYPCLRKLTKVAAEDQDYSEGPAGERAYNELIMVATLYAYVVQTTYGDLDALNLFWSRMPRAKIVATSGECLHRHCPYYPQGCMIHGLRQRAKCADIVVTNHALLFRDVVTEGGILPPIKHWIIDEAHSAPEEARKQLSPHVSAPDLFSLLASLSHSHSSVISLVRKEAKTMSGGTLLLAQAALLEEEARSVETLATSFFSFVKDLADPSEDGGYEYQDVWINQEVRETGAWGVVQGTGRSLKDHLTKLCALCNDLAQSFGEQDSGTTEVRNELTSMNTYLRDMRDALVLLLDGDNEDYVYSANINRNPDKQREDLKSSLINVGACLSQDFYPRVMSVIYTSATMATTHKQQEEGKAFEYFEHEVGFDLLEPGQFKTLQLASGYDYDIQMKVLVAADMPDPKSHAYLGSLVDLLEGVHLELGGSVLTLFTNRRDMEASFDRLKPVLENHGIRALCQKKGVSAKRLRDEFLADESACLFALRSFWEGFDAPGDTLRCVVITKLPFSKPDPLSQELQLRDKGAFGHYSLPEAVLSLKQAAGRLIRSSTDSGYLVICDSRVVTKRYGKAFLAALPSRTQLVVPTDEVPARLR